MKHFYSSLILLAAALAGSASGQAQRSGWVPLEHPVAYSGLLIGTSVGPLEGKRLSGPGGDGRHYFAVQKVRVEDSREFPPGALVDVYFRYVPLRDEITLTSDPWPLKPIDQSSAFPIGSRVLVVGAKASGRQLPIPDVDTIRDGVPQAVLDGSAPSLFATTHFETTEARLPAVGDPMWRLLGSVAGAIRGTSDENARRVASILGNVQLPEWKGDATTRKTDDRLSLLFAQAVEKDTAYRRALIDFSLNRLYYVGYGDRYRRDAMASALEPNAFPGGVPEPTYWEQPGNEGGLPPGFRHDDDPSPSAVVAQLKGSRSPTVAAWLLQGIPKPPDADVRALARFLDSPDPRLRRAFVERLSAWAGEPGPEEPRDYVGEDGTVRREYPGLNEAVARWKERLRRGR